MDDDLTNKRTEFNLSLHHHIHHQNIYHPLLQGQNHSI